MAAPPWRVDLARSITSVETLRGIINLTPDEESFFNTTRSHNRLPLKVSPAMAGLFVANADEPDHAPISRASALRRQFVPTSAELSVRPYELDDPLGEDLHSPVPRLIHRYPDRVLLLVTDQCAVHCRHCFRSRFAGGSAGTISSEELSAVKSYLGAHGEILEVILSGGDALMLGDSALTDVLKTVRRARPNVVVRVATRMPAVMPSRVTDRLQVLLRSFSPLWVIVQVNHPGELCRDAVHALASLVDRGIPILSQTVLLAGVNNDVDVLAELFTTLVQLRIKPYYLFQGDLAPGTSHLRVKLDEALVVVARLRQRISGVAMPEFAVDIPGGAGKVPLEPSALTGQDDAGYTLRSADGRLFNYPKE